MDQGDDGGEGLDTLADKVLALRLKGASWDSIADRHNMPVNLVSAMVADRLLDSPAVAHEVEVRLDLARLDALLVPAYRSGTKGDPKSIDLSLKILARRGELLSELDAAEPAGRDLVPEDGAALDDVPEVLSPAEKLARIRDAATAGATVLQLVSEVDDDDDE
ncbi:hypothetical protein ACH47B_06600 [Rhodococcus sp. NPDC019627]|uniref:hypothetical protein n=1 Tax=unclassified Rhodococcus (in: high G+C Gram-positive bacteria) TaxID=192944 RepID=UPI003787AFF7